jgi:DNA adenine methylase
MAVFDSICVIIRVWAYFLKVNVEVKTIMSKTTHAKPFVKWAGGKSQVLGEIRRKYPKNLGKAVTKYAEPFVGGGAVLFDVLANYSLSDVFICDVNRELIHTYITIRDNVSELIGILRDLETEYLPADTDTRKMIYYRNRERYNTLVLSLDESIELAALFIFLNKTCFNGLYRVNSKGGFNVPQGGYKNPTICDTDNLHAVAYAVRDVRMVYGDYWLSRLFIDGNTFVYFDPPYRPLTATASFTAYSGDGFGDEQQIELAKYIDDMSERGAWCVASNSDPTNTDDNDDFMDRLYAKYKITRITAIRAINSAADKRGGVRELLIARG